MTEKDVVIIGSGPAGLSAAIEAANYDLEVAVIDENSKPGGQLFKQIHKFFGSEEHKAGIRGIDIGNALLGEAERLDVNVLLDTSVLGIFNKNGSQVLALKESENKIKELSFKKLIIATGAREKPLAFPGWTLPGVLGAGAAQTLTNIHGVLPGKRILMVGSGNVGLIVAYQLIQAGAHIVSVIDILPEISGWDVHANKLKRMQVPILTSYTIQEVRGNGMVEEAIIKNVSNNSTTYSNLDSINEKIEVDTVCLAVGLTPMAELAWSAGCKFCYNNYLGGFIPIHNENMETTVKDVLIAGDISGIEEASTALVEGKVAGVSAAKALGSIKDKMAQERNNELFMSLNNLREGPLGKQRRVNKELINRMWYQ